MRKAVTRKLVRQTVSGVDLLKPMVPILGKTDAMFHQLPLLHILGVPGSSKHGSAESATQK